MAEQAKAFDPVTGDWLPPPDAKPAWDPEAPRRDRWTGLWHAMLALDLLTLALIFASDAMDAFGPPAPADASPITAEAIATAVALNLFLMGIVPFVWVVATRAGGLHGAMHYLKLERFARSLPWGGLLGLGVLVAVGVLGNLLRGTEVPTDNPVLEQMAAVMTVPLALFVAATAGWSEELLFRGILQRWIGVWGQAAIFGLAHASYGTPLQIAFPFLLGLLFGYLVKRGARLWVPILAHFTFDAVALLV